jgi:ribosome-binding protein aMBF1 (putative translation factor)
MNIKRRNNVGRKGETTGYVPMSFEEFYTRKLEAMRVELKDIIYGAIPYVVSETYACKRCAGRLKLHMDGKIYCLMCQPLPTHWSKQQKERVAQIMEQYPDPDAARSEWNPPRKETRDVDVSFGMHVEEARNARGWSCEQLAEMIQKSAGGHISPATLRMIERGNNICSQYVREQLIRVLGLREGALI